jgi:hypothetical protein
MKSSGSLGPDDSVGRELVDHPRRWDMRFIGRYMLQFGLVSSLFDILTSGRCACPPLVWRQSTL